MTFHQKALLVRLTIAPHIPFVAIDNIAIDNIAILEFIPATTKPFYQRTMLGLTPFYER